MEQKNTSSFSNLAAEHAVNPRNYGMLERYNGSAQITGPCGDTMNFWIRVNHGMVEQVSFITDGCGSSLACGSMTTCLAEGRHFEAVTALTPQRILDALGGIPTDSEHCALLSANTLHAACMDYLRKHSENSAEKGTEDYFAGMHDDNFHPEGNEAGTSR